MQLQFSERSRSKLTRIALALSILTLSACGPHNKDDSPPPVRGNSEMKDVTDHNSCQGQTPTNAQVVGNWHMNLVGQLADETLRFQFTENVLQVVNECHFKDGKTISVDVAVPYSAKDGQLKMGAGQATNVDANHTCEVHIPSETLRYEFTGRCLKLSLGNNVTTLVP